VTELYAAPAADVSFGDIFDASFLLDVHLRADAVQLGSRRLPDKQGSGMAYSEHFAGNRAYVLGHGTPHTAILITDNCVVDTALGQGRESGTPKGRLLFAPITPARDQDLGTQAFGRFDLPGDGCFNTGIAELRKCFMVDARDVATVKDARLKALTPDFAEELEVRWNAFAARRGPLAATRNADKMVGLLTRERGSEEPTAGDLDVGREVAEVVARAWRLEGHDLEAVADALTGDADGRQELELLEDALRRLSGQAIQAADALGEARRSATPST